MLATHPLSKLLSSDSALIQAVTDQSCGELLHALFFHTAESFTKGWFFLFRYGVALNDFGIDQVSDGVGIQSDKLNIEFACQSTVFLQVIMPFSSNGSEDLLFNITTDRFQMLDSELRVNYATKFSQAMLLKVVSRTIYIIEIHVQFRWSQGLISHVAVTEEIQYFQIFFAVHVHSFQVLILIKVDAIAYMWRCHGE